ncbi:MAG: Zn-ribbon containing protein [Candidatus Pacearchaeota archaeon]
MVRLRCRHCNYGFESTDQRIQVCPNCGERKFVSREKSADELLNEDDS